MELTLSIYGINVRVSGAEAPCTAIEKDFSFFRCEDAAGSPSVTLSLYLEKPPFETIPPLRASMYQPDSITYDDGAVRYVDFRGRALSRYDYGTDIAALYAEDPELLHELAYLLIHSRVGEMLDRKGMHRVHAMGVTSGGKGVICLLPQGGGKTTLCLSLLQCPGMMLLSDDTPLIDRSGMIYPFPARIGVCDTPPGIPAQYLSAFNRRKYGIKTVIDIAYFEGKIAAPAKAAVILIGERKFSDDAAIVSLGKLAAWSSFMSHCVIGLGLPQMVEYFLRYRLSDSIGKARIAFSRALASLVAVMTARTYRFVIGNNRDRNVQVLNEFLGKRS